MSTGMETETEVKRNKSDLHVAGIAVVLIAICIYRGETFGRNGGFSLEGDPYWFWGSMAGFGAVAVYKLSKYFDL